MKESKRPTYTFTEHENVAHYDWRLRAVTTVSERVTTSWGSTLEVGTPVVAISTVEYDKKTYLRYNLPSVSALLLSYAYTLYCEVREVRALFSTGEGTDANPKMPQLDSYLLDALEKRMAIVVFSYTAIESFANEAITFAYTHKQWAYSGDRPDGEEPYTLDDIQRHISLEDKLCYALPDFFQVKSLKKINAFWQTYKQLKRIRDFIVHPKLTVQKSPKERTLWKMLVDATFINFPDEAKKIMMHYAGDGRYDARWLHRCPF